MNRSVPNKIFHISLSVSAFAVAILCAESGERIINPTPMSEHIWSLSDEENDLHSKSIQHVMKKSPSTPNIIDRQGEANDSESDWEKDSAPSQHEDFELFFSSPDENAQPEKNANPLVPPKKEPSHLFHLENESEKTSKSPLQKELSKYKHEEKTSLKFSETPNKGWNHENIDLRPQGDISNAQQKISTTYYSQEENAKSSINFDNSENEVENFPKSDDTPETPLSLGKERVSVPPYTPPSESEKTAKQFPGTPSSTKTYVLPAQMPITKQGLFGPYRIESVQAPIAEHKKAKQYSDEIIAQVIEQETSPSDTTQLKTPPKTILINFNNVAVIEYIRFISRLTNKNFIFDETDLQFNVTIISEEPTTIDNVLTALIQELRIHGLRLMEEGNSFIIYQNDNGSAISRINTDEAPSEIPKSSELVTQVFRLNTLSPVQAQSILTPLLSKQALMGVANETRHIIITDLVSNIQKVEKLLKSIDAPSSGLVLGQYVVRNAFMDNLIELTAQIMGPIAQDQKISLIPHPAAKSIFIVSSPFIVERTISVLQHLDNFQGSTRIYDLEDLKFQQYQSSKIPTKTPTTLTEDQKLEEAAPAGKWELTTEGNRMFRPGFSEKSKTSPNDIPPGNWLLDPQNNWYFAPEGSATPFSRSDAIPKEELEQPKGQWLLDSQGAWVFQLSPGETIRPERLIRGAKVQEELPLGHVDRTKFYIYKLEFRKGEDIVKALQSIAQSLHKQGNSNQDLISTIESAQWLEASNSIIITGIDSTIEKVRELIDEIDQPQRQVMIEMLILDTTIDDSLTYGVSWGTRSGGGSTSTSQAFVGGGSPLVAALGSAGIKNGTASTPDASNVATTIGYTLGMIGQRLTHNGTQFASIGALVSAIHTNSRTNIILNPKIITEDNKAAEIFVGLNTPFLSNSIANDQGSIVTTNVEFKDTGTTLQVTPLIGHGNIVTLEIKQEVSNVQSSASSGGGSTTTVNLTPTTSIERTSTTVHVPDRCFVIISGMIQDQRVINDNQFPCLGGIPILGSAFKTTGNQDTKRNLMIFIRPEIIDTGDQFRDITKKQQQIFKQKNRMKKSWKYEVDQALDFMNLKSECCDECD